MQNINIKDSINEINNLKEDYKLYTFTNKFHVKSNSLANNENQSKSVIKNKYSPFRGEKLNKKNLNRFDSNSDYISELWNKIISKNLNREIDGNKKEEKVKENIRNNILNTKNISNVKDFYNNDKYTAFSKKIKINEEKRNSDAHINNKLKKMILENNSDSDNINIKEYEIKFYKNNNSTKEYKDTCEETNNNINLNYYAFNHTNNNFFKNKNNFKILKNEKIFTKINKKYKILYENILKENIVLKKENEALKNKINEINDEIDIMKEEDEINKENLKENENKLTELYEFIKQQINIYEQKILNYKELLFKKDQEIQRMAKELQKIECSKKNISTDINDVKYKIIPQEQNLKEFNRDIKTFGENNSVINNNININTINMKNINDYSCNNYINKFIKNSDNNVNINKNGGFYNKEN